MKNDIEYKLMKKASDLADDSWLASPAIQSALLGGLGYFGAGYLYDKLSNNSWQKNYINTIEDPAEREIVRRRFEEERERKKNYWRLGAGAIGAALPIANNYSNISSGWSKGKSIWGGPTIVDKAVGGTSGVLSATLLGNRGVKNMTAIGNDADKRASDFHRMKKTSSEKSYIYDNLEKEANAYNDAFAGVDFKMPYVRPLSTNAISDIPVSSSLRLINTPNNAAIMGPELNRGINQGFQYASGGLGAGLISTNDLIKSLTRVGIGYGAGKVLGSVLGTIFAQPPHIKEQLGSIGGIGGAVINSGILR